MPHGANVKQSFDVTPGHAVTWVTDGVIRDGGQILTDAFSVLTSASDITGRDLNLLVSPGIYYGSNLIHAPSDSLAAWTVTVLQETINQQTILQRAFGPDTSGGELYRFTSDGGTTWGPWVFQNLQISLLNSTVNTGTDFNTPSFPVNIFNESDSSNVAAGFSIFTGLNVELQCDWAQYSYNSLTQSKGTPIALNTTLTSFGSGEKFALGAQTSGYGMGDTFAYVAHCQFAGGPITGDEGQAFTAIGHLSQQPFLTLLTVLQVFSQSTVNTTITQNVTGNSVAQTVTVAATTNMVVGNWLVCDQEVPTNTPNEEAIQITGVGIGTVTGVFRNTHNSGATLKQATVLLVSVDGGVLGQDRVLVNLTQPSYTTGTVTAITVNAFTGSGTAWTSLNWSVTKDYAIELNSDIYNGAPFNGSAENGPLQSWYQVTSVSSNTALTIYRNNTAQDPTYVGLGPGPAGTGGASTYIIRPCMKVIRILDIDTQGYPPNPGVDFNHFRIVCESSTHTWAVNDSCELAVCPFSSVAGYQSDVAIWSPGASVYGGYSIRNVGARRMDVGYEALSNPNVLGSNADAVGWNVGFYVDKSKYAFSAGNPTDGAMLFTTEFQGATTDNVGRLQWGGGTTVCLKENFATFGMVWHTTFTGAEGILTTIAANVGATGGVAGFPQLTWTGSFKPGKFTFADLPAASAALEGTIIPITNSTTGTWGATISGTGAFHVLAYCDGTNWTVMAV